MVEIQQAITPDVRLKEIRAGIDGIDEQIVALWVERNRLAAEAGTIKRESGLPVYAHERDLEVRDNFGRLCEDNGIRRDVGREAIGILMKTSYEAQGVRGLGG